MDNRTDLIKKLYKLALRYNQLNHEILNDPDIPQNIKDIVAKNTENFKNHQSNYQDFIEQNNQRKIVGYNIDTFQPIYED